MGRTVRHLLSQKGKSGLSEQVQRFKGSGFKGSGFNRWASDIRQTFCSVLSTYCFFSTYEPLNAEPLNRVTDT